MWITTADDEAININHFFRMYVRKNGTGIYELVAAKHHDTINATVIIDTYVDEKGAVRALYKLCREANMSPEPFYEL